MRLRQSIWIIICFFCSIVLSGFACDTSLIRMFASQSPEESYFKLLEKMAINTEKVGSSAKWGAIAREPLQNIMEDWLVFETEFRITPPDWIEYSEDWSSRFTSIAHQIGIMRVAARNNEIAALHDATFKLSLKLNNLLLEVELSEQQQITIQFPLDMQHLRILRRSKDRAALHELSLIITKNVRRLQLLAQDKHKHIFEDLIEKTVKLHSALDKNKPNSQVFNWNLYGLMKNVEDTFKSTTEILLEHKNKEKEEEDKND